MSISSISEIYNRLYTSMANSVTNNKQTAENSSSSGSSNLTDILELSSSENDLSAYLNYDATGNYNSLLSLADYLSEDDAGEDYFSSAQSSSNSLTDLLNSYDNDESNSGIFDGIIDAKSKEIDNLISRALEKLSGSGTQASDSDTDKEG